MLSRTGWVASASATGGGDVPANMLDGNTGTRWSTGTPMVNGQTFTLDLGSAKSFSKLMMDSAGSTGDYAHGYQVFVSTDGTNFGSAIATGTPDGSSGHGDVPDGDGAVRQDRADRYVNQLVVHRRGQPVQLTPAARGHLRGDRGRQAFDRSLPGVTFHHRSGVVPGGLLLLTLEQQLPCVSRFQPVRRPEIYNVLLSVVLRGGKQ